MTNLIITPLNASYRARQAAQTPNKAKTITDRHITLALP
jgi:hypothetical protein